MASAAETCACSEDTGADTCMRQGTCEKTQCTLCQECLEDMRDPQNITTGALTGAYSISTGSAFETSTKGCAAQVAKVPTVAAPTCADIKAKYFTPLSKCGEQVWNPNHVCQTADSCQSMHAGSQTCRRQHTPAIAGLTQHIPHQITESDSVRLTLPLSCLQPPPSLRRSSPCVLARCARQ